MTREKGNVFYSAVTVRTAVFRNGPHRENRMDFLSSLHEEAKSMWMLSKILATDFGPSNLLHGLGNAVIC